MNQVQHGVVEKIDMWYTIVTLTSAQLTITPTVCALVSEPNADCRGFLFCGAGKMPDHNGKPTLRDRFPIQCRKCKGLISSTDCRVDKNGNVIAVIPGERYRIAGMVIDGNGIPANLYEHDKCPEKPKRYDLDPYSDHDHVIMVHNTTKGKSEYRGAWAKHDKDANRKLKETTDKKAAIDKFLAEAKNIGVELKREKKRKKNRIYETQRKQKHIESARIRREHYNHMVNEGLQNAGAVTDELGTIFKFGTISDKLGYDLLKSTGVFPDFILVHPDGEPILTEFEYKSSNFIAHKHDAAMCDLVICWIKDRELPVPVLEIEPLFA